MRRARTWWGLLFCLLLVCAGGASAAVKDAEAQAANADPVANDNAYRVKSGDVRRVSAPGVLNNDLDPDGDGLLARRVSAPDHGRLDLRSGGSFVYTPDRRFRGEDSFVYRVEDGNGGTDTATVELTVWREERLPLARSNAYSIEEDGTLTVPVPGVLGNDARLDGRRLFATKVTDPGHGSLSLDRAGSFVYTPERDFSGEDSFVYRARDSRGNDDQGTVRISVDPVNDAPVFTGATSNTSQTIDEGAELAALQATDADGDALAFELTGGSLPPGITLGGDGRFAGAAGSRAAGDYAADLKVSDGGETDTTELAVTVSAVEEAALVDDSDVATDEDVAKTITLTATDADTDSLTFALGTPGHGSLGTASAPDCATSAGTTTCTTTVLYTPDADFNGPDSFTYTAGDSAQATVDITVNAVNDEPVAEVDSKMTPENTPLVFPASDLVANDSTGATNENAQTLTVEEVTNPQHGTVVLENGEITFTPTTDYNGPAGFDYTVCDSGNPQRCSTQTAAVDVTVSPVNSRPVAEDGTETTEEDADPIQVDLGALVSDVETSDANLVYTIVTGPASRQGTLTGNGPTFTFDSADDFDGAVEISYKVTDRGDPDNCGVPGAGCAAAKDSETKTVTITVDPVNDMPRNIALSSESVDENEPSSTLVGTLSSTDPDAGDTHSYALVAGAGSDDNGQFQILNDRLETAAQFDRETKSSYAIRVSSTDSASETFEKQLTITVDNVNEASTDVSLAPSSVDENEPSGTDVGTLSTTDPDNADPDNGDTFTYALVAGTGSDDNAKFQVIGSTLKTSQTFDYETKSSYTVRMKSIDSGDTSTEKALAISVADANDAPTATDDTGTTDEDTILNVSAPGVLGNDADEDAGDTRTVGKLNGSTTLTGTSAEGASVTMNTDGSYTYDPGSVFQPLLTGQSDTDTFTYNAKDAGGLESNAATVTITIDGVTDPPVISSGGTLDYRENDEPTPVDGDLSVTHPEGARVSEATVKITGNYRNGEDFLAFSDNDAGDGISQAGSFDSTTGELKLTGNATAAEYQAALRSVTYKNTSEDPSTATRTVTFKATDVNSTESTPATRDISVTPVDDPPVAVNDSATVLEDADATNVPVLDNDTDVDAGPKTIDSIATQPTNGTVAITGGGTGLTYKPNANYCNDPPASNLDTFTYRLNGGSPGTVSMTVTCVNDAPVADNETFDGNNSAIGNTTMIANDPDDGAPSVGGLKKTISGDILDGDTDVDGPGPLEVVAGTLATNDGGSVTIESDGDFTYINDPADSCADTSDFFDYTVTDKNPGTAGTDTGQVNVAISGCVWYVNNDASGNSGTSTAPFDTLAQAQTASGTGHSIFVSDGNNTSTGYAAGIDLKANQKLIGEAATLTVGSDTLHTGDPAKHPTITDNNADVVALDDANEVRGVELDPQGTGGGIAGAAGDTGGVTIDDVRIIDTGTAGAQPGLELDSTTGTFDVSNLTLNNTAATSPPGTAIGVRLNNAGTVNFAAAGANSINVSGARGLDVLGTNMGTGSVIDGIIVSNSGSGGVRIGSATSPVTGATTLGDGAGTDLSLTTTSGPAAAFELNTAGTVNVASAGGDDVHATGGPAVDISGTSGGTYEFDDVDSTNSAGDGINLDGLGTGTFTAMSGDIGGYSGTGFDLDGGSGAITYPGNFNNGTGTLAVDVTGRTAGPNSAVTFSGPFNDTSDSGGGINVASNTGGSTTLSSSTKQFNTGTGDGVVFNNSDGHTLTLSGGSLDIDTTDGRGLEAATSGTLNVVGTNNTINTTTGRALNVTDTDIGASDLAFQSISANGAPNGIVLNNTGKSGDLSVTGNGGTCTSAATCTGGAIQNSTGAGIVLASASGAVNLTRVAVTGGADDGIRATSVGTSAGSGLAVADSIIQNNGNAVMENGLDYDNVLGTSSINTTTVTGSGEFNARFDNDNGTARLTVNGSTFSRNSTTLGADGLLLYTEGTATVRSLISNSTFSANRDDGFQMLAGGDSTVDLSFNNNQVHAAGNAGAASAQAALNFNSSSTSDVRMSMTGGNVSSSQPGLGGSAIIINPIGTTGDPNAANTSTFDATFDGVTVGTPGVAGSGSATGIGIWAKPTQNTDAEIVIKNSQIHGTAQSGIQLRHNDGGGDSDFTVTGNTIRDVGTSLSPAEPIYVQSASLNTDATNVCADIGGASPALENDFAGQAKGGLTDIAFTRRSSAIPNSHLRLPGYNGSSDLATYVGSRNAGSPTATNFSGPLNDASGVPSCQQPTMPVLP